MLVYTSLFIIDLPAKIVVFHSYVSLPIYPLKMVIFNSYVNVYQEGSSFDPSPAFGFDRPASICAPSLILVAMATAKGMPLLEDEAPRASHLCEASCETVQFFWPEISVVNR